MHGLAVHVHDDRSTGKLEGMAAPKDEVGIKAALDLPNAPTNSRHLRSGHGQRAQHRVGADPAAQELCRGHAHAVGVDVGESERVAAFRVVRHRFLDACIDVRPRRFEHDRPPALVEDVQLLTRERGADQRTLKTHLGPKIDGTRDVVPFPRGDQYR